MTLSGDDKDAFWSDGLRLTRKIYKIEMKIIVICLPAGMHGLFTVKEKEVVVHKTNNGCILCSPYPKSHL